MTLPPALDRKIRNRFDELIKEGAELASKMKEHSRNKKKNEKDSIMILGEEPGHTSE